MTPRRLVPYLLLFLVLVGAYVGLTWRQERQEAREQETRRIFPVKEDEIRELALLKGKDEIHLARQGLSWEITRPVKDKADPEVAGAMLSTLAHLKKERDLGAAPVDLTPFGLAPPALEVTFATQDRSHRLLLGAKAPGERHYYAFRDQERNLLLISAGDKESLDRPLSALRDKTLLAFDPDQVKRVKLRAGGVQAELQRTGPRAWRWVGREATPVRTDRVELLLRQLQYARILDFAADEPRDLTRYGLAPRPATEVTLETEPGAAAALFLGSTGKEGAFARRGAGGPVLVVDRDLPEKLARTAGSLEDRRLWTGAIAEVEKVTWGPAGKGWTAVKEKDFWNLSGPGGQEVRQHAARVELALRHLQDLEYRRLLPQGAPAGAAEATAVALFDGEGKPRFRLEAGAMTGKELEVWAQAGEKTVHAAVPAQGFEAWQTEMDRLTVPPKKQ